MDPLDRGYREIEHTADWELEVWGPDMSELLVQAARGIYELMGVELAPGERTSHQLVLESEDDEGLLVAFLGELLFLAESAGIAFDGLDVDVEDHRLEATLAGADIAAQTKEIKAVTFHRLQIRRSQGGVRTRVVFDV